MAEQRKKRGVIVLSPLNSPTKQRTLPIQKHPKTAPVRIRMKNSVPVSVVAPPLFPASYYGLPESSPSASFNDSLSAEPLLLKEQLTQVESKH